MLRGMTMQRAMTPEERNRIYQAVKAKLGANAPLPAPEDIPDEFYRSAAQQLEREGGGFMQRAMQVAEPVMQGLARIDDIADQQAPYNPAAALYKFGWSPAWDYVLRPTLDRAEDIGEFAASPIIQSAVDAVRRGPSIDPSFRSAGETAQRYMEGGSEFIKHLFPGQAGPEHGGMDFRGAVDRATDAMGLDPYVAGAAGVIGDPTNFIPGAAFTKPGQAAIKGVQAAADVAGPAIRAGAEGLAMLPMGVGGVGGGGARRGGAKRPPNWLPKRFSLDTIAGWGSGSSKDYLRRRFEVLGIRIDQNDTVSLTGVQKYLADNFKGTRGGGDRSRQVMDELIEAEWQRSQQPTPVPEAPAPPPQAVDDSLEAIAATLPPEQAQRVRDELMSEAQDVAGPSPFKRAYMEARRAGQGKQQSIEAAFAADATPTVPGQGLSAVERRNRLLQTGGQQSTGPTEFGEEAWRFLDQVGNRHRPLSQEDKAFILEQARRLVDETEMRGMNDPQSGLWETVQYIPKEGPWRPALQAAVDARIGGADAKDAYEAGLAAVASSAAGPFKLRFRSDEEAAMAPDAETLAAFDEAYPGMIRSPDVEGAEDMIIVDADDIERGYLATSETDPNKLAIFSEDGDVLGEFDTFEEANAAIKALPPDAFDAPPPPLQQMTPEGQSGMPGLASPQEGQMDLGMGASRMGQTPRQAAQLEEHRVRTAQQAEAARQQQIEGQEYGADYGAQAEMAGTPEAEPITPTFGGREQEYVPSAVAGADEAAAAASNSLRDAQLLDNYPVAGIEVMPTIFQARGTVDPVTGADPSHYLFRGGVQWDPVQAPIIVWRVPEGGLTPEDQATLLQRWRVKDVPEAQRIVPQPGQEILVHGHNRLAFARQQGVTHVRVDMRMNTPLSTLLAIADEGNTSTFQLRFGDYLTVIKTMMERGESDEAIKRAVQLPRGMNVDDLLNVEAAGPVLSDLAAAQGLTGPLFKFISNIGYFAREANFKDNIESGYKPYIDQEQAQSYFERYRDTPALASDAIRRDFINGLSALQLGMFGGDLKAAQRYFADMTANAYQVITAAKRGNEANKLKMADALRQAYGHRADEILDEAAAALAKPPADLQDAGSMVEAVLRRMFERLAAPVEGTRKAHYQEEVRDAFMPNLQAKTNSALGRNFAAFFRAALDGTEPFDRMDVFGGRKPRSVQQAEAYEQGSVKVDPAPAHEELTEAQTVEEVVDVASREVDNAAATAAAMDAPEPPVTPTPLDPLAPSTLYEEFRGLAQVNQLDDMAQRAYLMANPDLIETVLRGAAEVAGDAEAQRLRNLIDQQTQRLDQQTQLQDAMERAIGPLEGSGPGGGGGGPRIPRGPDEPGDGFHRRYGGRGRPPEEIQVGSSGYSFKTLPSVDDKIAAAIKETSWQKLADALHRIPGGAAIVRVVNASGGLSQAPVQARAQIARELLEEQFEHDVSPAFAWVEQLGTERTVWGRKDDAGRVTVKMAQGEHKGQQAQAFIQEIVEDPKRFELSEAQLRWVNRALVVTNLPKQILTKMGQRIRDYNPGPDLNYTGLILVQREVGGNVIERGWAPLSNRRGLAGQAPLTRDRQFDTLADAMEAGFLPEPSYMTNLRIRMRQAGRQAVFIRVSDYIRDFIRRAADAGPEGLEGVSVRKNAGELHFGEHNIALQVLTKEGIGKKEFRIAGPEAKPFADWVEKLKVEAELEQADIVTRVAGKVGSEVRFAVLTMDASVFFIQGGAAMLANPGKTVQSGLLTELPKEFARSFLDPEGAKQARAAMVAQFAQRGGYAQHPELITDYGGFSEFTEAAGGLIGRTPIIGEGSRRAALAFDNVRDIIAIRLAEEGWKAGLRGESLSAHDRMVNKMLGRLHSRALGVSGKQRAVESAWFMLAPQYFRATVGMLAQVFEVGAKEGADNWLTARKAMSVLATAGGLYMMLVAAGNALNTAQRGGTQEQIVGDVADALNPTSRNILSIPVDGPGGMDFRIGIGGMFRAIVSLVAELAVGAEFQTGRERYGGNWLGHRVRGLRRFGEARMAPAVNVAQDVWTGRDFIGRKTDPTHLRGLLRLATSNTLPIWLQEQVEEFDAANLPLTIGKAGAGIMGVNARDLSASDVREWETQKLYRGRSYEEIDGWEKGYVSARAWPQLERLYMDRANNAADRITSAHASLMGHEYRQERERKLLSYAVNPSLTKYQMYDRWKLADEAERSQRDVISDVYDQLFGERPGNVPENELQAAYQEWRAILGEDNEERRQQLFQQFNARYPFDSDVGVYIRAQTNTRRVPFALLNSLSTYQRAQGVYYSAKARERLVYERVLESTGDAGRAEMEAANYLAWFFMLGEEDQARAALQVN